QPERARPLRAGVAIFVLTYGLTALDGAMRHYAPQSGPVSSVTSAETDSASATLLQYRERTARSIEEKEVLTNGSYADAVAMRLGHLA
ncbi:hypothetical protein LB320_14920, partial [Staphylococcus aureus]